MKIVLMSLYEKDRKYNYSTDMRYISKMINSISIPELLDIYAFFKRAGVADDCMRNELVEHLLETRQ